MNDEARITYYNEISKIDHEVIKNFENANKLEEIIQEREKVNNKHKLFMEKINKKNSEYDKKSIEPILDLYSKENTLSNTIIETTKKIFITNVLFIFVLLTLHLLRNMFFGYSPKE